jgi:hypothetical protein
VDAVHGMAGYGGPLAAAKAALKDYWSGIKKKRRG